VRIDLGISAAGDQLLANNYIEIFVFPYVLPTADADVTLYDPLHVLSSLAGIVGTKTAATPSAQVSRSIIVTNVLDDSICRALENGAAVLCLADTNTQCPEGFPAKLVGRENSWYDGNWASNLNWLEGSHPVFRGISFSNHLGFEAAGTVPDRVLADIAPEHFSDVIAGMFVGWVHLNSGYLMQMNAGRGKLLVCTFRIADHIQSDPYASLLLNRLTEYIASPECTPATEWNLQ
jgi:hypothetical protein